MALEMANPARAPGGLLAKRGGWRRVLQSWGARQCAARARTLKGAARRGGEEHPEGGGGEARETERETLRFKK